MRRPLFVMLVALFCLTPALVQAQVPMTLAGQLQALATDVKANLKNNELVAGQKVALGQFAPEGKRALGSNFGLEIERQFQTLLAGVLDDDAKLTLAGSYHFVESEESDNKGLDVLLVTVQIKNARGKQLVAILREINDTDDISRVLGLTAAVPNNAGASIKERNEAAKQAVDQPEFSAQGHLVSATARPGLAMGLLKKATFDGTGQPVAPQNVQGKAFTPIGIGDYYDIELANDEDFDVVAIVSVDGLDVANTFCIDTNDRGAPVQYPGYLVPRGQRTVIHGWLHSVKPSEKDNVFTFRVAQLGEGAASQLNRRGKVGVVTVQFREVLKDRPKGATSRSPLGETTKGEGRKINYSVKSAALGDDVLSTVSVRYNRPE